MLGPSTGGEDTRYLLLTAMPQTATFSTSALSQELLLLEAPGLPPPGPSQPLAQGRQEAERMAESSLGVGGMQEDSYPKIHFLDHLLGVTLQNHATR